MHDRLRIGYIPLLDAAALIVAVEFDFAAAEGLAIELVREVSWSNVRDKLNIGLFDAAHLLSPVAIASSLGLGHVRVPIVAPLNLGLNGNAISVSMRLFVELSDMADGDLGDPMASARALSRVVRARRARGAEPLAFGMTFPYSNHNYQLRFWMAAGGTDPDEDVQLVVLPPPYMVESLASGHVDGFCVGAPWNSVAVDSGVGRILHLGCEIMARVSEKVLAVRAQWVADNPHVLAALVRALARSAEFLCAAGSHAAVCATLARHFGVSADLIRRSLAGEVDVERAGAVRRDDRHILIGRDDAGRPDPIQAAWLFAQIVRWHQAPMSDDLRRAAQDVFRPDLYDAALGRIGAPSARAPADGVGAFSGPAFDPADIAGHIAAWNAGRRRRLHLSAAG